MNPTDKFILKDLLNGFRKGHKSFCWYVEGKHLEFSLPYGTTDVKTFVLMHTSGIMKVGYLAYCDGSLTFFTKRDFRSVSDFLLQYPDLFSMSGKLYPL